MVPYLPLVTPLTVQYLVEIEILFGKLRRWKLQYYQ